MRKKLVSALALTAFAVSGSVFAREFRAPLVGQDGPLRYDVYKKKDKWTLNFWSVAHNRSATKAFMKHGTDTHDLAALFFGKEEFKVSEAFSKGVTSQFSERFNANLNTTKLTPRVSYTERGMVLGGRFEYPVWQNKGRIGVRGSVPFRTVRVERDNDAETAGQGDQRNVIKGDLSAGLRVPTNAGGGGGAAAAGDPLKTERRDITASLYRVSFVKDLPFVRGGATDKYIGAAGGNVQIGGSAQFNVDPAADFSAGYGPGTDASFVVVYNKDTKTLPVVLDRAIKLEPNVGDNFNGGVRGNIRVAGNDISTFIVQTGPNAEVDGATVTTADGTALGGGGAVVNPSFQNLTELPRDAASLKEDVLYAFKSGEFDGYRKLLDEKGDNLWLMTVANDAGNAHLVPATARDLDVRIERYGKESVEQWLWRNNFQFTTNQRTGLGDIDVDVFYEHDFNEDWRGEVSLGLRLPTGGSSDYSGNPYKANPLLGNGNHVEVKLGANVGWATPWDWLNVKANASYSFVVEATEQRAAAFKGATVYGIGPKVDADVDWGYFCGSLDATVFHRKTDDLSTTIGYEIYYKTEDNVTFKNKTLKNAWFGRKHNGANFVDFEHTLDNAVAERNTERIAHRLRFESHWHAHKYMSIFAGGAFTFAGQNVAKESDVHCGMKVRF